MLMLNNMLLRLRLLVTANGQVKGDECDYALSSLGPDKLGYQQFFGEKSQLLVTKKRQLNELCVVLLRV